MVAASDGRCLEHWLRDHCQQESSEMLGDAAALSPHEQVEKQLLLSWRRESSHGCEGILRVRLHLRWIEKCNYRSPLYGPKWRQRTFHVPESDMERLFALSGLEKLAVPKP